MKTGEIYEIVKDGYHPTLIVGNRFQIGPADGEDFRILSEDGKVKFEGLARPDHVQRYLKLVSHASNVGRKDDSGKSRLELLPPKAIGHVGLVLAHGAAKYGDDNWRKVENAKTRYLGAALRHTLQHLAGERLDSESGEPHLAHAVCSLLFVLELVLEDK